MQIIVIVLSGISGAASFYLVVLQIHKIRQERREARAKIVMPTSEEIAKYSKRWEHVQAWKRILPLIFACNLLAIFGFYTWRSDSPTRATIGPNACIATGPDLWPTETHKSPDERIEPLDGIYDFEKLDANQLRQLEGRLATYYFDATDRRDDILSDAFLSLSQLTKKSRKDRGYVVEGVIRKRPDNQESYMLHIERIKAEMQAGRFYIFSTLTSNDLRAVSGLKAIFKIKLTSSVWTYNGYRTFEVEMDKGLYGTVWLAAGEDEDDRDELTVTGTLVIINQTDIKGNPYREYRIVGAKILKF